MNGFMATLLVAGLNCEGTRQWDRGYKGARLWGSKRVLHAPCAHCAWDSYVRFSGHCFLQHRLKGTMLW